MSPIYGLIVCASAVYMWAREGRGDSEKGEGMRGGGGEWVNREGFLEKKDNDFK